MTYIIKQLPEDFVVEEDLSLPKKDDGKYAYFLLKKKGLTTEEALQRISKISGKPRRLFSCCGNKDKR
ncbi:tRNA pseudouridine(13) synthase TruD, partial [Candidatus Woesearchaeota archaeon]|nr:tRNA pseudouridine(13) synthase TruD [Candidatus Woesearchaeota archaeon]